MLARRLASVASVTQPAAASIGKPARGSFGTWLAVSIGKTAAVDAQLGCLAGGTLQTSPTKGGSSQRSTALVPRLTD